MICTFWKNVWRALKLLGFFCFFEHSPANICPSFLWVRHSLWSGPIYILEAADGGARAPPRERKAPCSPIVNHRPQCRAQITFQQRLKNRNAATTSACTAAGLLSGYEWGHSCTDGGGDFRRLGQIVFSRLDVLMWKNSTGVRLRNGHLNMHFYVEGICKVVFWGYAWKTRKTTRGICGSGSRWVEGGAWLCSLSLCGLWMFTSQNQRWWKKNSAVFSFFNNHSKGMNAMWMFSSFLFGAKNVLFTLSFFKCIFGRQTSSAKTKGVT